MAHHFSKREPGENEPQTTPDNEHTTQLSDELHYSEPKWEEK